MSLYRHRFVFSFLHVCGGVSNSEGITVVMPKFSPRMWRCFWLKSFLDPRQSVFSTYVEVFVIGSFGIFEDLVFSPRMWRCFQCE